MGCPAVVRPGARKQIEAAFRWYENQAPGLGKSFFAALETTVRRIEENPLIFVPLYRQVRRALLPRFPYGVFFVTEPDRVVVLAVLHAARNPASWPGHH